MSKKRGIIGNIIQMIFHMPSFLYEKLSGRNNGVWKPQKGKRLW